MADDERTTPWYLTASGEPPSDKGPQEAAIEALVEELGMPTALQALAALDRAGLGVRWWTTDELRGV